MFREPPIPKLHSFDFFSLKQRVCIHNIILSQTIVLKLQLTTSIVNLAAAKTPPLSAHKSQLKLVYRELTLPLRLWMIKTEA